MLEHKNRPLAYQIILTASVYRYRCLKFQLMAIFSQKYDRTILVRSYFGDVQTQTILDRAY
jgi:hypothetical protein